VLACPKKGGPGAKVLNSLDFDPRYLSPAPPGFLFSSSFHLEENGKRVERHKLAELLIRPNTVFEWLEMLELISQALDAAGNALLLIVRDERDQPRELLQLMDLMGRIFFTSEADGNAAVDTQHLTAGVYFIRLRDQYSSLVRSFVKRKFDLVARSKAEGACASSL
jgi:hypothetical protein